MDQAILEKLIYPWRIITNQQLQKTYYYNTETNDSQWQLPQNIIKRLQEFEAEFESQIVETNLTDKSEAFKNEELNQVLKSNEQQKNNIVDQDVPQIVNKISSQDEQQSSQHEQQIDDPQEMIQYLQPELLQKLMSDKRDYMSRPARKQIEQTLALKHAYRQGDEEYNIWYDKYLTDTKNNLKQKEASITRCDPELDGGFTKADQYQKNSAFFCLHFSHGCCCEGVNCKFFHKVPSRAECQLVDNSRDIFGRPRFATHRDDRGGVGSFMCETRTLEVSDFKIPSSSDPLAQMYEILWRHFSVWGIIEDINVNQNKALAFIKYEHRCMAEYAKEAMYHQSLDKNEILTLKWHIEKETESAEPEDIQQKKRKERDDQNALQDAMERAQRNQQQLEHQKIMQEKRQEMMQQQMIEFQEIQNQQRNEELEQLNHTRSQIDQMNSILNRIQGDQDEQVIIPPKILINSVRLEEDQPLSFNQNQQK